MTESLWRAFQLARLDLIRQWDKDGKLPAEMLDALSMDLGQVHLLILTARGEPLDIAVCLGPHLWEQP